jgi:hypothetical protein
VQIADGQLGTQATQEREIAARPDQGANALAALNQRLGDVAAE